MEASDAAKPAPEFSENRLRSVKRLGAFDASKHNEITKNSQAQNEPHSAAVAAAIERHHNRLLAIDSPPLAGQEGSRDLLRDAVCDGAADAISYLEGIRVFTACDDIPALRYSTSKFALFAREIVRGSRKLTGDKLEAEPDAKRIEAERVAALRPSGGGRS
jgi:hypothetical protein